MPFSKEEQCGGEWFFSLFVMKAYLFIQLFYTSFGKIQWIETWSGGKGEKLE